MKLRRENNTIETWLETVNVTLKMKYLIKKRLSISDNDIYGTIFVDEV